MHLFADTVLTASATVLLQSRLCAISKHLAVYSVCFLSVFQFCFPSSPESRRNAEVVGRKNHQGLPGNGLWDEGL